MLMGWIKSGLVAVLWLGTPCSGFSRARRGPPGGRFPCALRSAEHLSGLPDLPARDRELVRTSNLLAARAAAIQRLCIQLGVPGGEENPASSFLWDLPSRKKTHQHPRVLTFRVDYCSCGCPFRARTRLHIWHAQRPVPRRHTLDALVCKGRGICEHSGRPHERLSGSKNDQFLTVMKSAYPKKLSQRLASMLLGAVYSKHVAKWWPRFSGLHNDPA